MNPIQTQIDYARTQPWFPKWINALRSCGTDETGQSIIDLIYWTKTAEGHRYWEHIENQLQAISNFEYLDDLELADLQPYLPDYPEIFL